MITFWQLTCTWNIHSKKDVLIFSPRQPNQFWVSKSSPTSPHSVRQSWIKLEKKWYSTLVKKQVKIHFIFNNITVQSAESMKLMNPPPLLPSPLKFSLLLLLPKSLQQKQLHDSVYQWCTVASHLTATLNYYSYLAITATLLWPEQKLSQSSYLKRRL